MIEPDTILQNRYRIAEPLGGGGMGEVYLAYDMRLADKRCAVKQLIHNPNLSPEERVEDADLFRREAATLAHLNHPNLPDVYDYFEREEGFYLVMEYIEGETLARLLDEVPEGLSQEKVILWALQLCDVLDYLHHQDPPVIFRDLKPANVMITENQRVKLIDFGIVRLFDPTKSTDTLKMGTAGYAPPEQYAGQGQTTPRSDIYSLGATLYELLTGEDPTAHPFVFKPPRKVKNGISPALAHTIMRAVNLDPKARFSSAQAMRSSLQKAMWPGRFAFPFLTSARLTQTSPVPTGELQMTDHRPPFTIRFLRTTARFLGSAGLALVLTLIILLSITTLGLSFFAERAIAEADWYLGPHARTYYEIEERKLTEELKAAIEPYLFDAIEDPRVEFQYPDKVQIRFTVKETPLYLQARLTVEDRIPDVMLEKINNIPLYIMGGIISNGIRRGFESAWENADVYVETIDVKMGSLAIEMEK